MLIPSVDRVIIEVENEAERKVGSIFIPATSWLEYQSGRVVAVGPGPSGESGRGPMTNKVGDRVIFPPSLGRRVPVRQADGFDKEYVVIRQHEIAITIKDNPTDEDANPEIEEPVSTHQPPRKIAKSPRRKAAKK